MNDKPRVELVVRQGLDEYRVAVDLDPAMDLELRQSLELSDDPLALCLAGGHRGLDVVAIRKKTLKMRRAMAEAIAKALVEELVKNFGENDRNNEYRRIRR